MPLSLLASSDRLFLKHHQRISDELERDRKQRQTQHISLESAVTGLEARVTRVQEAHQKALHDANTMKLLSAPPAPLKQANLELVVQGAVANAVSSPLVRAALGRESQGVSSAVTTAVTTGLAKLLGEVLLLDVY